ncbi:MAG: hypothetical protein AUK48_07500 [Oscillatoriales cyanobacterium CG2_30_44_21]|nr:MAG: hypothetical protein AUK48_07500 [Oscillatoriales cyanobacterium CG2_30_44_21]
MDATLIRQLVWLDYRLAFLFNVLVPLGLLTWAVRSKNEAVRRSLLVYWRVASLTLITIYIGVGRLPIFYVTGILSAVLIVLSLWFWQDLNEDIGASQKSLNLVYLGWRWAVTAYCVFGGLLRILFVNCAFINPERWDDACKVWFEPALSLGNSIHRGVPPETLAFVGVVAGIIYILYLFSFLAFSLPKNGRIAFRD